MIFSSVKFPGDTGKLGALKPEPSPRIPWHGAQFDLRTGEVMTPPACENINAYPVYVKEGNVVLEVGG